MKQASLPGMKIAALRLETGTNYQQLTAVFEIGDGSRVQVVFILTSDFWLLTSSSQMKEE